LSKKRPAIAKPGDNEGVTFAEWLKEPERYVRRGEVTQVIEHMLRLWEAKKKRQSPMARIRSWFE